VYRGLVGRPVTSRALFCGRDADTKRGNGGLPEGKQRRNLGFVTGLCAIQSVSDLGDGRYELAVYLWNVGSDTPIYVMSPDMHAYVQVGKVWQEVPLEPADSSSSGVLKIDGKQTYRYVFDARVKDFTQLLPNYMHVRFSDTMLVSPSSMPKGDVFERKDNFYVYLKPFDVADEVVLKRMKFSGKPPVWIPMPPH
jgi:putative ABC transport system ATP-binding protein/macrolide transport system ATP-binding/permease protein/lipoprotein-releasing system ATP-binding protein